MFEADLEFYGVDKAVAEAFAESLHEHIAYVQEAHGYADIVYTKKFANKEAVRHV